MSNNKIDWTKPVQTKENPPRRVTIIETRSEARSEYPVKGYIHGDDNCNHWTNDGSYLTSSSNRLDLENIPTQAWQLPPPPATQPVLTQRTESILLTPPSEPIFSEATIRIKIEDEAAGEFLMFESLSNDGKLRLDPDEWPAFKAGVEFMLSEIEKHKKL
jgi:hypothetical protein